MAEVAFWKIYYLLHDYLPSLTGKRLIGQIREVIEVCQPAGGLEGI